MKRSSWKDLAVGFVDATFTAALVVASATVWAGGWLSRSHVTANADAMALPKVMLWAWERPEDLRFLNPHQEGVSFLARTIELRSLPVGVSAVPASNHLNSFLPDNTAAKLGVRLRLRMQPLQVTKETPLMAVVRIETSSDLWHRPEGTRSEAQTQRASATSLYSDEQREQVAMMAAAVARLRGVTALQIDFDASRSEQPFYAALLRDVRRRLPPGMPLSITALASWCIGDPWLDQLPPGTIDEAVPMLFRMGPDAAEVSAYLESGSDFRVRACRSSLGVSTDEPFSQALLTGAIRPNVGAWASRRIYIFASKSWVAQDVDAVTTEITKWHRE